MPGDVNPSKVTGFKRILFPWTGIARTATAIANQEKSFNSLAQVILDNRIALDHILAEKDGVCSVNIFTQLPSDVAS